MRVRDLLQSVSPDDLFGTGNPRFELQKLLSDFLELEIDPFSLFTLLKLESKHVTTQNPNSDAATQVLVESLPTQLFMYRNQLENLITLVKQSLLPTNEDNRLRSLFESGKLIIDVRTYDSFFHGSGGEAGEKDYATSWDGKRTISKPKAKEIITHIRLVPHQELV